MAHHGEVQRRAKVTVTPHPVPEPAACARRGAYAYEIELFKSHRDVQCKFVRTGYVLAIHINMR